MPLPITFTEQENQHLESIWITIQQDAQQVQYYPNVASIISKLQTWPVPVTFTEQESREIQSLYVYFDQKMRPFPVLQSSLLTFGQDQRQIYVIESILAKLQAAQ